MTMEKKEEGLLCHLSFWSSSFSSYYYTSKKNKIIKQGRSQGFWSLCSSVTKMNWGSTGELE